MPGFMVSLRDSANGKHPGPPRYLKIEDGQPTELGAKAWADAIVATFPDKNDAGLPIGDLLFFVHGFNVGFDDALKGDALHRDRLADLGWTGVYVSFDWPSRGRVSGYLDDTTAAQESASALIKSALSLFVERIHRSCEVRVSVMAHSMGALVVREAFVWASRNAATNGKNWSISQLLLVAPDISQDSLRIDQPGGRWLNTYVGRTTLYLNRYDNVLKISDIKNNGPTPRAGRVGLPAAAPPSFCSVDCSDRFYAQIDTLGDLSPAAPHCFYFEDPVFWQDAILTMEGGIDRSAIPNRFAYGAPNRFRLNDEPLPREAYRKALKLAQLAYPPPIATAT